MKATHVYIFFLFPLFVATNGFAQNGLDDKIIELSQKISREMSTNQKTAIAVVEFSDLQGNVTDFGRFLSEELITKLYQTKRFIVVERQMLNKIITEQKLSLTGIVDQASARQLGKLYGVDAIVSGTITDLSQTLRINTRLISTATGEIFAVASTDIYKDESVSNLLMKGTTISTHQNRTQTTPITPRTAAIQKTESNNFTFVLRRVTKSGTSVTFELVVTNNDRDREVSIDPFRSRFFDEIGNEYKGCTIRLGNRDNRTTTFISGIPVVITIIFDGVSSQAKQITVLEVFISYHFESSPWQNFNIQLRNIPISYN